MTGAKFIIYHVPFKLNPESKSASGIRPIKMLEAFKNIGFTVDVVAGNACERKKRIKEIKLKIKSGVHYEFCYSESSTQPTLHTEPYSFVKHPFFEFEFFKYLKKKGVKIGLFYRDIYWCFPEYATSLKEKFYGLLYRYDLWQYNRLIDVLFVPSVEMMDYINVAKSYKIQELPSGTVINTDSRVNHTGGKIEFIYAGGIGDQYNLTRFIRVVSGFPNIHFTLCCRKEEWEKEKHNYLPLMSGNVEVVHVSGKELGRLMAKADIGMLYLEPTEYRRFAMPYKLMEFIGWGLPVLSSAGTKAGQFVGKNRCGWTINYDESELQKFLGGLGFAEIMECQKRVVGFAPSQTWESRAREVVEALTD